MPTLKNWDAPMSEPSADDGLVTVESRKYDGRVHRAWRARVAAREGALIILEGKFDEEIRHPLLGHIVRGTLSREYYWIDRWYSVFRFREPDGALRNYYCNINQPAAFDGRVLSFVDLDVDMLIAPDFSIKILDEDEFASNAARFAYPSEFYTRAAAALKELTALIEQRAFPFDELI